MLQAYKGDNMSKSHALWATHFSSLTHTSFSASNRSIAVSQMLKLKSKF